LHKNLNTMITFKQLFPKIALQNGLIAGAVFAVYTVLLYVFDVNLFNTGFTFLNFLMIILILVFFMVKGVKTINRGMGHPLSYGQKFVSALLIGMIAVLISSIVSNLLYMVIDPEAMTGMMERFVVDLEAKLERAGMSDEMIETQMTKVATKLQNARDPWKVVTSSLINIAIMPAIVGLIVAAAVNTRKYHEEQVVIIEENQE
jgi:hypothetical protein